MPVACSPFSTESAPSSGPTLRCSSNLSGAGSAPPFSSLTSSDIDSKVKLPSMIPVPPGMAPLMTGAEMT